MSHNNCKQPLFIALIVCCLLMISCGKSSQSTEQAVSPATIVPIPGTNTNRVSLTPEALKRIDLQTQPVGNETVQNMSTQTVPYSALLYDPHGQAWVYIQYSPRTFMRVPITVDSIEADKVYLSNRLPNGTLVVSVGATELYGTEYQGSIQP